MNRGNFFKALGVVLFAPKILKDINWDGGGKCVFNEKRINEQLEFLRKYPMTENECYPPEWAKEYETVRVKNLSKKHFKWSTKYKFGYFDGGGKWKKIRNYAYNNPPQKTNLI